MQTDNETVNPRVSTHPFIERMHIWYAYFFLKHLCEHHIFLFHKVQGNKNNWSQIVGRVHGGPYWTTDHTISMETPSFVWFATVICDCESLSTAASMFLKHIFINIICSEINPMDDWVNGLYNNIYTWVPKPPIAFSCSQLFFKYEMGLWLKTATN